MEEEVGDAFWVTVELPYNPPKMTYKEKFAYLAKEEGRRLIELQKEYNLSQCEKRDVWPDHLSVEDVEGMSVEEMGKLMREVEDGVLRKVVESSVVEMEGG